MKIIIMSDCISIEIKEQTYFSVEKQNSFLLLSHFSYTQVLNKVILTDSSCVLTNSSAISINKNAYA